MSIALWWPVISPAPASSQEIPDEDLLALSLEELLSVRMGVASLEDELIIETPAVVSYPDPASPPGSCSRPGRRANPRR